MDYRRKPMRAKYWNYNQDGTYFITTVIHQRAHLLGSIENGAPTLSDAGEMVERYWLMLENKYTQVRLEEYVIMPNHVHGLIRILPKDALNLHPQTLGDMMKWFKAMTSNAYIRGVKDGVWPPFDGKFWQPEYWDHIVRDDKDQARIVEYIEANPYQWELDPDNANSDDAWEIVSRRMTANDGWPGEGRECRGR